MAIIRTPIVDDDGSGTTGTVIDNAWKQELYTQIDVALGAILQPTYGSWTPGDASGAGLVFSVAGAAYCKVGRLVWVMAHLIYPATANSAPALIGGLPFIAVAGIHGGLYQGFGTPSFNGWISSGGAAINLLNATTGGTLSNAQMSGANFTIHGSYLTTEDLMAAPHPPAGNQSPHTERPLKVYGEQYLEGGALPIGVVMDPVAGDPPLPLFSDGQPRVLLPAGWVVVRSTDWIITNRYSGVAQEVVSAEEFAERFGGGGGPPLPGDVT